MPQTLEAALEIKEMRQEPDDEDLFDDEPALDTWVFALLYMLCSTFHIYYVFRGIHE
jgi:hypothetical protein